MNDASLKSVGLDATLDNVSHSLRATESNLNIEDPANVGPTFRLYKRRWSGLVAVALLNMVAGMNYAWFGPIATNTANAFGFSIKQVNWFSNVSNVMYICVSPWIPSLYNRIGIRRSCYIGAVLFISSAWIRYAGTVHSLSTNGALALIMIGQILAGASLPIFQVLIPRYSEKWFDLKTRITATMLMSLGNPIGNALGQLISPIATDPRQSILVMAVIFTVATPIIFFVGNAPPTPPTHSGSSSPSFESFVRAFLGKEPTTSYAYTTPRQRIDFVLITFTFGVLDASICVITVLSAQIMEPYGYSDTQSGLFGAVLLLTGLVAAGVTAPLFDRFFSKHLALSAKCITPIIAACWLSLVWVVKRDNLGSLFAVFAVIGAMSLTLLPVAIELAVEVTKNADASSAVLWCSSNMFALIFILSESALRAGGGASPPYNMHHALIFQACWACTAAAFLQFVQGRQTRREQDERAAKGLQDLPAIMPKPVISLVTDSADLS